MITYIISQILCVFGLILFVISMQKYTKKAILTWQTYSFSLYTIQYFLLGAYSGMLIYLINMIRSLVFSIFENRKQYYNYIVVLFILISFIVGIAAYKEVFDIIPIINSILSILNVLQKDTKNIKTGQIIISVLWIIYDINVYSYIASITEFLIILSAIRGLKNTPKLLCEKI